MLATFFLLAPCKKGSARKFSLVIAFQFFWLVSAVVRSSEGAVVKTVLSRANMIQFMFTWCHLTFNWPSLVCYRCGWMVVWPALRTRSRHWMQHTRRLQDTVELIRLSKVGAKILNKPHIQYSICVERWGRQLHSFT